MAGIEKDYFSLEEIESQWGIPHRDLVYLAENGLLKVSVRLYGIQVENGSIEETEDGEWFSIPEERIWFVSEHVRCRSSVLCTSEGSGVLQTSFASEVRRLTL